MVAFRAKVDGKWQANFQRRLRCRVTGLRPSGLPNLPFSLVLSPPPFVLHFPSCFPFFLQFFLFSPFSLLPPFFAFFSTLFQHFSFTSSNFQLFPAFFGQSDRLHVTPVSAMCPTRHLPHTGRDTLWKMMFAYFSAFLGTFKKTGSYLVKRQKRKVFAFT